MKPFDAIKYIAFDLDGTLVDSVPDLAHSLRMMLADMNMPSVLDEQVRNWIGNGTQIMIKRALTGSVHIDEEKCFALYEKAKERFDYHYDNNGHSKTIIYKNVQSTLLQLQQAGYLLGIITNKPYQFVPAILSYLKLDLFFSDIIGGDSLPTNKPSAEGILFLRDKYGLQNENIMMVGDSKNDILAAKNAGCASIGLTYGYNYAEPISDSEPDIIADDFADLLTVLNLVKKE